MRRSGITAAAAVTVPHPTKWRDQDTYSDLAARSAPASPTPTWSTCSPAYAIRTAAHRRSLRDECRAEPALVGEVEYGQLDRRWPAPPSVLVRPAA